EERGVVGWGEGGPREREETETGERPEREPPCSRVSLGCPIGNDADGWPWRCHRYHILPPFVGPPGIRRNHAVARRTRQQDRRHLAHKRPDADAAWVITARTSDASASCRACPRSSCRAPSADARGSARPTSRPRPCPHTAGRGPGYRPR